MPTHLYCLLPRGSSATPPTGIRMLESRVALAWVADTAAARLSRDVRDAARATLEHDRVVGSALVQGVTPLPASLADAYDDDAAVLTDIESHAGEIEPALSALQGAVEMTTIVSLRDSAPDAGTPARGKAYLEQLRSAPARAREIADRIVAALSPHSSDSRRRGTDGTVAVSHLLRRNAVDAYRSAALAQSGEGYRIVIDGPRAPYSFALFSPRRGLVTTRHGTSEVRHDSGDLRRG